MDLKPRVDPADDQARFAAWVRASDFAWLPRSRDGRLLGSAAFKVERRAHEGRECVLLWTEYVYALPEARQSVGVGVASLAAAVLGAMRRPGRPMYLFGAGYVTSYVSLAHVLQRAWVRDEPGMSPWERSLWRAIAAETKGYDPVTQVIDMDTIPRHPRTAPPRDPRVLPYHREYVARNPRWAEGYACLVCARIGLEDLTALARQLGRRALRRALTAAPAGGGAP